MTIAWQQTSDTTWRGSLNGYEIAGIDQWGDGLAAWLCIEIPEASYSCDSLDEPCIDLEHGKRVAAEMLDKWVQEGLADPCDNYRRRARLALKVFG
ncbi:hypothetical protein [Agrobacterium sp. LAD9]|uniref:hypothetical protein n=1 Tax=Agrobacterium sp. LAD9 TaxID=2055153 RepID=UPI000D1DE61F|nr:hypothetical protein [Agrobacterium sp. LAD9]